MRTVPIQYDGYNRQFKLVNAGDGKLLEDGTVYLLVDFSSADLEAVPAEEVEVVS